MIGMATLGSSEGVLRIVSIPPSFVCSACRCHIGARILVVILRLSISLLPLILYSLF
jgi:hypothetical protein